MLEAGHETLKSPGGLKQHGDFGLVLARSAGHGSPRGLQACLAKEFTFCHEDSGAS